MQLKQYALYKYIALTIGIVTGFLQPTLFNKFFSQENFAFLLLIYGYATYLIFFDFGVSKPIYSDLRNKYVSNIQIKKDILRVIPFFNIIILFMFVFALVLTSILANSFDNTFSYLFILFFVLTIVLNFGINYLENILNAVDNQMLFQKVDLFRRGANLLTLFAIFIDSSFMLSVVSNSIILLILYGFMLFKIKNMFLRNKRINYFLFQYFFKTLKKYWNNSYRYFIFSFNEVLLYNVGYILVPIFLSSFYVIQYALWMKLYLGMVMFSRVIGDTFIHKISKLFFKKDLENALKLFYKSILLSGLISGLFSIVIFNTIDIFFMYWVDQKYIFDSYLLYSLILWNIFNSIQHTSGIFLLAEGKSFNFMKNISFYIMLSIVCTFAVLLYMGVSLGVTMISTSLLYAFGSLIYFYKAYSILKGCQ